MLHGNRDAIVTDRHGSPRISGIHDAEMTFLSVEFGQRLTFDLKGVSGEQTRVVLDGLQMLNIGSLWEGVIINAIAMWPVRAISDEVDDNGGSGPWEALLSDRVHPDNQASDVARLKREYAGSYLVEISSSYGGELRALCRDVLVNERRLAPV